MWNSSLKGRKKNLTLSYTWSDQNQLWDQAAIFVRTGLQTLMSLCFTDPAGWKRLFQPPKDVPWGRAWSQLSAKGIEHEAVFCGQPQTLPITGATCHLGIWKAAKCSLLSFLGSKETLWINSYSLLVCSPKTHRLKSVTKAKRVFATNISPTTNTPGQGVKTARLSSYFYWCC